MPIKKIVGPKSNHDSPAGLDTRTRDGPFAQLIAQQIVNGNVSGPNHYLLKDCLGWSNASDDDWLEPPVKKVINGHQDAFSQRLDQVCRPGEIPNGAPEFALFNLPKVVIVSNGRCAVLLFSASVQAEGVKAVVVGVRENTTQQYCGTIGGQSTDISTTENKDSPPLPCPPDFASVRRNPRLSLLSA
ncbi:hypothetical protein C0989_012477 [Termitomyces sp. Mn162]|nr:hypothetical protein C0989_012477 [Termitomyces sp. Mn162]